MPPLRTLALIIVSILLLYGAIKALPLLSGPELTVLSPAPYASLPDGYLPIRGVAKYTETVQLNGNLLLIDQEGRFETLLLLPPGNAILVVTATDRFGRTVEERREVFIP